MNSRRPLIAVPLILLLAACGSSSTVAPTSDTAALEALFYARQDSARMRFTPEEVEFMTGMIGHHAQALIMSGLASENGAGPSVSRLATRIINAQNDEIATMQRWLADRGQPVPEVHIDGLNLMLHGVEAHHAHMPGMLSDEQMRELAAATGPEFDRVFLTYMIQHHRGAVTMVQAVFDSERGVQDEAVFKVASDINVDQLTEIARMQLMLDEMGGTDRER